MKFKITFLTKSSENKQLKVAAPASRRTPLPRRSVVQVYFEDRHRTLSYYNDRFTLRPGDIVYVEGKLEGLRGRVTDVTYNFKIRLSDYKRVIAVADTSVTGRFFMLGDQFVTFDSNALPPHKVLRWYKAPEKDSEVFVSGYDDTDFPLQEFEKMYNDPLIAERGRGYHSENRVRYISVDSCEGYAIVEGTGTYEVEFRYCDGKISHLVCSCFCSFGCKHEYAVMLQLRETLDLIEKYHSEEYQRTGYFAAVHKETLIKFALTGKETGSFTIRS